MHSAAGVASVGGKRKEDCMIHQRTDAWKKQEKEKNAKCEMPWQFTLRFLNF